MRYINWRGVAAAALLAIVAGCSGNNPVTGKVTYEDGSPVVAGTVIAEKVEGTKRTTGTGPIKSDGTFSFGTTEPGTGLPVGHYRVLVLPPDLNPQQRMSGAADPIAKKWQKFESSGLVIEVKKGKNDFPFKVSKPDAAEVQEQVEELAEIVAAQGITPPAGLDTRSAAGTDTAEPSGEDTETVAPAGDDTPAIEEVLEETTTEETSTVDEEPAADGEAAATEEDPAMEEPAEEEAAGQESAEVVEVEEPAEQPELVTQEELLTEEEPAGEAT